MYVSKRLVSTSIASAFNKLHANSSSGLQLSLLRNKAETGLFGNEHLMDPSGFHVLQETAINQSRMLVEKATSGVRCEKMVSVFDQLSNCLCKVADLAEFVRLGHPIKKFKSAAEEASMSISCEVEKLNTNKQLYDALKTVVNERDVLPTSSLDNHVAKLFLFDFEQNGIHLPEETRQIVLRLNEYILQLGSLFMKNTHAPRAVPQTMLPLEMRKLFAVEDGSLVVNSLYSHSEDETVREMAYRMYLRPEETQEEILTELIFARKKLASLCGFKSFAERAISGSIAGTPENVWKFLSILSSEIKPLAAKDYAQMLELKQKVGSKSEVLNPWDIPFYSSLYKESNFSSSVASCAPYFSLGSCMEGINMVCDKVFGIHLEVQNAKLGELWSPEVVKLAALDKKSKDVLGYIYCDFMERTSKLQQDCHFTIQGGCQLQDSYQLPVVVICLSLPNSTTTPTLLTPQMVDNLFHEMGHAIHSIVARTPYQHITGTRCSTDLAEVPSILMENFACDARVVKLFARHYFSGEPIPERLLKDWIQSKKVFTASDAQLQVFYSILDQTYHGENPLTGKSSTTAVLKDIQDEYYGLKYIEGTAWQLRFGHLVGYGAKYYSYLVSRAVARLIWQKLFLLDPLSPTAGEIYKKEVLSHGGGKPPGAIVESVLEAEVSPQSLALSLSKSL